MASPAAGSPKLTFTTIRKEADMLVQPIRRREVLNLRKRFRSAITGQFVTRLYALLHPAITISERVR